MWKVNFRYEICFIGFIIAIILALSILPSNILIITYCFLAGIVKTGIVLSVKEAAKISDFGHLTAFFLLTVSCVALLKLKLWKILVAIFIFSFLTELSQYFVSSRFVSFEDLLYNFTGIILGIFLAKVWVVVYRIIQEKVS